LLALLVEMQKRHLAGHAFCGDWYAHFERGHRREWGIFPQPQTVGGGHAAFFHGPDPFFPVG